MSSGPQDSANTLYYNNNHYNDTDKPIPSYHKSDLRSTLINNGSNYQIAINKLKISSLEGVKIGDIPVNKWQIGLEVEDKTTGNIDVQIGYVSSSGVQPITNYLEYYAVPKTNGQVTIYKSNGNLTPTGILTFQPTDGVGNTLYALNAFYDYNNLKIWVVAVNGVYLYDSTGNYISNNGFTNIINSNFNVQTGTLIICDSDFGGQIFTVAMLTQSNNVITSNTITNNTAGQSLTNLRCADTDGSIIIVGYNNNQITTYNYHDRTPIIDSVLSTVTKITNILIDSVNNQFIFIDDQYIPYLMVASEESPTINRTNPNFYDVATGDLKITNQSFTSAINANDLYEFSALYNPAYIETYIGNTSYNNLSTSTTFSAYLENSPYYISVATGNGTGLLIGITQIPANTDLQITTKAYDNIWSAEYAIPSAGGLYDNNLIVIPQVTQDPHTQTIYIVFGEQIGSPNNYKIIRTSTAAIVNYNTRPAFTYSGTWKTINTNIDVESMVIDPNYNNVFWAVGQNVIYKGYLINDDFINFVQWQGNATAGQTWRYFITQPFLSANYNPVQQIIKNKLSDFSILQTINSAANNTNYTCIQQSINKSLLYVANGEILQRYNSNFNFVSNVSIDITNGNFGHTTGTQIDTTGLDSSVYSMGQFIRAFNNTFSVLYGLFSDKNISAKTAPTVNCDYTTKFATLNYDPNWSDTGYGIYVNESLYKYLKFQAVIVTDITSPFYGMYKYTLNSTGTTTQSQYTLYQLNQIDKLLVLTNLSILGDFSGTSQQTRIFTDLDLDTQEIFFTGSGNILYDPQLLRKYDILSNIQINMIEYEFKIQYKNGLIVPYYIPPGENVSIKLEFDRVY